MKNEPPSNKSSRKPWKIIKGKCRDISISRWQSDERTYYCIWIPERNPPRYTTSNEGKILERARILADVPADKAPSLMELPAKVLPEIADAVQRLKPILEPLQMSISAGLDEYGRIKMRLGLLNLDELFDGLLAASPAASNGDGLAQRLREISGAITKLTPVLSPLNLSVASGIEEYASVKAQAGNEDLRALFKQVLEKLWVKKSRTPIGKVADVFLQAKKHESHVRDEYHNGLYYSLRRVASQLGRETPIGDITTEQLKPLVFQDGRNPRTSATYRTNIRTFFKWCQIHEYLDYGRPTAADQLERINVERSAPRILTVAEARAILSAIEDEWCLLYLVLSLFTGIRHDELQRLKFDMIKSRVLEIPAKVSKTHKRRLVPLQPALQAWLAPFRGRSGLVIPRVEIQRQVRALMESCGLPDVPAKWARNWCRQSYCSYRLAQTGEVLETAKEDGHKAYTLETIYLELSTKLDALKYFALTPDACGKPDWKPRLKKLLKDQPEIETRPKGKNKKSREKIGIYDALEPSAQHSAGGQNSAPKPGSRAAND